jgi:hypothetical protein
MLKLQVKLKIPQGIGILSSVQQNGKTIENASFCQIDEDDIATLDSLFRLKDYELQIFAWVEGETHNLALKYNVTALEERVGKLLYFQRFMIQFIKSFLSSL